MPMSCGGDAGSATMATVAPADLRLDGTRRRGPPQAPLVCRPGAGGAGITPRAETETEMEKEREKREGGRGRRQRTMPASPATATPSHGGPLFLPSASLAARRATSWPGPGGNACEACSGSPPGFDARSRAPDLGGCRSVWGGSAVSGPRAICWSGWVAMLALLLAGGRRRAAKAAPARSASRSVRRLLEIADLSCQAVGR